MKNTKKLILILLLLNSSVYAMNASTSSSSSSSTSATLTFSVPAITTIINAYTDSTPDNITDVIATYSPNKILFESYYTLCLEKSTTINDTLRKNLFESALLAYALLFKTVENTNGMVGVHSERLHKIIEALPKNYEKQLTGKLKKLFTNNLSTLKKLRQTHVDQIIAALPCTKQTIDQIVTLIKTNLMRHHHITTSTPEQNLSQIALQSGAIDLIEQTSLLGCNRCNTLIVNDINTKMGSYDLATQKKRTVALTYSPDPIDRHNLAIMLSKTGQKNEAIKWATISLNEGHKPAQGVLDLIESNAPMNLQFLNDSKAATEGNKHIALLIHEVGQITTSTPLNEIKRVSQLCMAAVENGHTELISVLPLMLYLARDYENTVKWGLKIYREHKNEDALFRAGLAAYDLQRFKEALTYFSVCKSQQKGTDDTLTKMAMCNVVGKNYEKAKQHLEAPLQHNYPEAYLIKLYVDIALDNRHEAHKTVQHVEQNFSHHEIFFGTALSYSAYCLTKINCEQAEAYAKKANAIRESREACYVIAASAYHKRDYNTAIEYFKKATKLQKVDTIVTNHGLPRINIFMGLSYFLTGRYKEAITCSIKAYKLDIAEGALIAALSYEFLQNHKMAEKYFKKAIAAGLDGASSQYAVFLDKLERLQEAEAVLEELADDQETQADIQEDNIARNIVPARAEIPKTQDENRNEHVPVEKSKRYLRLLEKAKKEAELAQQTILKPSDAEPPKSYKNVSVTLSSTDIQAEIAAHELRIQTLLSGLSNGEKIGRFETLSGYHKRCSMRITKADRLVFDIIEGGINDPEGVKSIVIVSAKGHYENVTETEYDVPTRINLVWSREDDDVEVEIAEE